MYTSILALIAILVLLISPAVVAKGKGRSWPVWLLLSICFPLISFVVVLFLPSLKNGRHPTGKFDEKADRSLNGLHFGGKADHQDSIIENGQGNKMTAPSFGAMEVLMWIGEFQSNKKKRKLDPSHDIEVMLQNESWSGILDVLSIYLSYAFMISGLHEDYERDSCYGLVSNDGPFSDYLGRAFEDQTGSAYSKDEAVSIDDLKGYAISQDDKFIFDFLRNYLCALCGDDRALPGLSGGGANGWKPEISERFLELVSVIHLVP